MVKTSNCKGTIHVIKLSMHRIQKNLNSCPLTWITRGTTFCRWFMYLVHFHWSTVFQKSMMPLTSSSLCLGFTSLWINSFNSCQRFSIGFRSGDSGGVRHQLMLFFVIQFCVWPETCFGSCPAWIYARHEMSFAKMEQRVLPRISVYSSFFNMPSKMHTPVHPLLLIPAQMCTFVGCFGL